MEATVDVAVALGGGSGAVPLVAVLRTIENAVASIPDWIVRIVQSAVVLVVAYGVSRLVVRLFGRRIARQFKRPTLSRTVIRLLRLVVFLFAGLSILHIYGLELSDIALSVTVFSAVVGVVLAPIVGSIISGLFLLADRPYEIGDMVELSDTGQRGFVDDVTLRYTKLFTLDNTFLVVPNGSMRDRDVTNFSAEDPRTRQSIQILVTYESDIDAAQDIVETGARHVPEVIEGGPDIRIGAARYPAGPNCYIDEYADHGVLLTLRYWVREPYKLLTVRSKILENVWEGLADAPVEIAYPHSHLFFDETSGELPVALRERSGPDTDRPRPDAANGAATAEDRPSDEPPSGPE